MSACDTRRTCENHTHRPYAQVLDLSHNRLRRLPPELGWLTIRQLDVSGNGGLVTPPKAVLAKGLKAVLSYLQVCVAHPDLGYSGMCVYLRRPGHLHCVRRTASGALHALHAHALLTTGRG